MHGLRSKLPPPNTLVAFEAAARHLSFTSAATELNVTRVAVSNQVKTLEDFLGVRLFERRHRSLRLTAAGEALARRVSISLIEIAETAAAIRAPARENRVTVTTSTGFVTYWLLPRIGEFRRREPEIDLRFLISDKYVNLAAEGVDVAIRYGDGHWPGIAATRLVQEEIFPVCSPKYLAGRAPFREPAQVLGETLLHLDGPYDPQTRWATWFASQGVEVPSNFHGISFNTYTSLVQAALDGQGIALLGPPLLGPQITEGALIRPIEVAPTKRRVFWLAVPQGTALSRGAGVFCDWVAERFASQYP